MLLYAIIINCIIRKIDLLYTDDADVFRRAAKMLGIPWDKSQPGQPKNNSISEALGAVSTDTRGFVGATAD